MKNIKKIPDNQITVKDNISIHLKNIYAENELEERATTEDFSVVQKEGERDVQRTLKLFSLEAIIAVGYRVSSERGTQFRQWAITILKDAGKVSHEVAEELAKKEYDEFRKEQDHKYISDFDNHLKLLREEVAKYGYDQRR